MLELEMSDLASAYSIVAMRLDERAEQSEEDYFTEFYSVDLDKLSDIFSAIVSRKFSLESAFRAFRIAYELGYNQATIASTPTVVE